MLSIRVNKNWGSNYLEVEIDVFIFNILFQWILLEFHLSLWCDKLVSVFVFSTKTRTVVLHHVPLVWGLGWFYFKSCHLTFWGLTLSIHKALPDLHL